MRRDLPDLACVDPPATTPIDLATAKAHLRFGQEDDGTEDALITGMVDAAVAQLDGFSGWLGRALITQSWALSLPAFPPFGRYTLGRYNPIDLVGWRYWASQRIPLPLPPLQEVTSIAYVDPNGAPQILGPSQYQVLDGVLAEVLPAVGGDWPATQDGNPRAVTITYKAGYGDTPADVPQPLRTAMLLLVGHFYLHREAVVGVDARDSSTELPLGVSALCSPYRTFPL